MAIDAGQTQVIEPTDAELEAAMQAFIDNVCEQDNEWTDDFDEELVLTSPTGDAFALLYPIRAALIAARAAIIPASPSEAVDELAGTWEGAFRDLTAEPAVKALTVDEIRPTDDITARLDNLAQQIAADGEYPPHTLTDLAEAASKITTLRKALGEMLHAVCHETGFANAVREDSGISYPWPALDIAEANARAALAQGGRQ